jgi:hypothetical protein
MLFPGFVPTGKCFSKLEIIFCAFLPRKGVQKRAAENNFVNALVSLNLFYYIKQIHLMHLSRISGAYPVYRDLKENVL